MEPLFAFEEIELEEDGVRRLQINQEEVFFRVFLTVFGEGLDFFVSGGELNSMKLMKRSRLRSFKTLKKKKSSSLI
jgi:hypothetical protein